MPCERRPLTVTRIEGRQQRFELHRAEHPAKCHGIQERVYQQREDSAVNSGTATCVHHRSGYKDVPTDSEQNLMSTVAQQTMSTTVETDQSSFQPCSRGGDQSSFQSYSTGEDHDATFAEGHGASNKGKRRENRSLDDVRELDDARQSKVLQGRTLDYARQGRLPQFPQLEHRADSEATVRDDA